MAYPSDDMKKPDPRVVAAHSGACCRWVVFHRGVSQRDDTYEALVSTDDWQPPDLYIAHHWANWRLPKWFQSK
jgi:hypothetical protein